MPKRNIKTPATTTKTPKPIAAKATTPKPIAAEAPKPTSADKAEQRAALATRIAAERATAATLFAALDKASVSIPVKSLTAFKRSYKRNVTAHAIGRKPTIRQAAALAIACLASGKTVKNGSTFPRKFDRANVAYAIENGALSDALASGLCTYDIESEAITITGANEITAQIGTVSKLAI